MAETLTIRTASSTEVVKISSQGPQGPKGDKGDPGDVAGLPLSVQGDTLYRGASENQRLPIGTSGQVLKVSAGGIPEWANESGAVSSVAGKTGVVTLDKNDVGLGNVSNTAQVTSVNGTAPIVSSGGTTPAISISAATTSAAGSMSAADKTKLDGIAAGAEVNVNADWNATSGDAQILNKPTLGGAAALNVGTTTGTVAAGDDARLSDSRTPTAHAASHASAGSDPLFDQDLNQADSVQFDGLRVVSAASQTVAKQVLVADDEGLIVGITGNEADARASLGLGDAATADIGTGSTEVAAGNHVHGNLTNDGKLGSTAGLPVVTTTAGAVTTLALGTANQVLRVNSGATGVEFADPAASGVTGAAASASDVLGVSGANITGVDANADRIVYWNNTSNKLAYGTPADAGAAAASHTHAASDITSGTIDTARLASGTANSGTFLRGDQTWAAVSGVTTGSVDNAILRADGTGGSTSQGSAFVIADNATASPNNTVNHASIQATGDTTNVSVSIVPKGTGAFMLRVPDSASTGGNSRGVNAVDLMLERTAANQVASGEASFAAGARHVVSGSRAACVGGYGSTASNDNAVTLGALNTATGSTAGSLCGYFNNATATESVVVGGNTNNATAARSAAIGGNNNTASADSAICLGGQNAAANRFCIHAHAAGQFAAQGDAQRIRAVLRCATTTNAAVEMALNGSTTYLTIPANKVMYGEIYVVGVRAGGADVALYRVVYAAKNVAGTSTEVFSSVTTDAATGTSLEVATVDAGDYIRIRPTGVLSQNWRWVAKVDMAEVTYG